MSRLEGETVLNTGRTSRKFFFWSPDQRSTTVADEENLADESNLVSML